VRDLSSRGDNGESRGLESLRMGYNLIVIRSALIFSFGRIHVWAAPGVITTWGP